MTDFYPNRIICLTEEPTEILYLLGEQDRIVGVSGFTVRPSQARKEKPKVSAFIDANISKIIDLKPDLVIGFSDIQAKIAEELIKNGITVLINNHRTVEEIYKVIVQIGSLVGKTELALQIASSYRKTIHERSLHVQNLPKPKVYFEEWFDPLITGISWVSELIELAGGEDVCIHKRGFSLAKDRILKDPSEMINLNPDIIIASWCGKKFKKEKMLGRENWHQIKAIQNDFVFEINSSIILQPGPAALTEGFTKICNIIDLWHKQNKTTPNSNF